MANQYGHQPPLSVTHPEISKSWDKEKNGDLTPDKVVSGSAKKVYWICPKGHSIHVEVRRKVRGDGCGVCANRILETGYNDLETVYPAIAAQWHKSKNGDLLPSQVLFGARIKVWWMCENGHEWQAFLYSRDPKTYGCSACLNKKVVTGENDLQSKFPAIASEWDFERNAKSPSEVTFGSNEYAYWICPKGHSYRTTVSKRTLTGQGCKYCSGSAILAGFNDLQTLHPDIASKFHPTLNGTASVNLIASQSKSRYVWVCQKGHNFSSTPQQLVKGYGCGVCAGKQIVVGVNDLNTKAPKIAAEWNFKLNDGLEPTQFTVGSEKMVWWICPLGHDYKMRIDNRYFLNRQCSVCANRQVQVGVNDLETVSPMLAKQWDYSKNKDLKPSEVTSESTSKAWWLCNEGHSFYSQINFRANRNVGCPKCVKAGFDQSSPATFYFIENPEYFARKVGIANQTSDRLAAWQKRGWKVLWKYETTEGQTVLNLETKILRWIRKDLGLPPHLGDKEIGSIGGWSETFSYEGVSNFEVIQKIESTLAETETN